ncbi:MAG: threonine--tRNA ligase [Aigarchaeota archaeon]|nr:threonine--tRNA ligase [Aigarchaeota archaeon]MCX8192700.1 threonine--tRNA ligase [Nitrososphaeria archaeon]MDW7987000.1 threonine--tRNA ligase [Nitrososphaerota archaeon]
MKILQLHVDYIEYEPIEKESSIYEEVERRRYKIDDALLILVSVEKDDEEELAREVVKDAVEFMAKMKISKLVVYPYAHLSTELAPPHKAYSIIKKIREEALKNVEVHSAPFGWNKRLVISVKGHPLAEQLRSYGGQASKKEEQVSKALLMEEKLKPLWFILTPEGRMVPLEEFDFTNHQNLEDLARYEIAKSRAVLEQPPHVQLMKKLEIADYESGSDPGNMRWPAKGRLIKSLLEQYVTEKVIEYGGIEVETPIMYDMHHPSLEKYLHRFPARQYIIKTEDKDYFLRFAACFGQFLMASDMVISHRHLPLWLYELTRYSFRREKSGELAGLRRLRAFTMPDVHAFCKDIGQSKNEMKKRLRLSLEVLEGVGLTKDDLEMAIRFTKDFYQENRDFILELVREFGKPVLVEMWEEKFFYFILKWELNFIDSQKKAAALSTDQIDVENSKQYGITFVDEDGVKKHPIILHCSPSGAIERLIYALLEKAYMIMQRGGKPMLPIWLSPTQIRIIPVAERHLEDSIRILKKIEEEKIRVDIDDREETVDKKIKDAEVEWIPYIVVYGDKEKEMGKLAVRIRETGKIEYMSIEELVEKLKKDIKDKPYKPLPLPKYLSKRPSFK